MHLAQARKSRTGGGTFAVLTAQAFTAQVARSAERHRIPGISAAFDCGGIVSRAHWGVLNLRTQIPVTADSVFQIGSITKVFTGTLVMQLVDAGSLDLDAPVGRYLPDVQIAGAPIDSTITVRMLLAHTSGIAGDFFVDTSRNDDATRLYVERCGELAYLHAPGRFSYCNSGYVLLGRMIEILSGRTWVEQLRVKLLEPLGMEALGDAEDGALFSTAAGHVLDAAGAIELTPTPYLPRSTEAAGARLSMSAGTLLTFARMHLRDGLASNGTRVLSEASARAMREMQIALPFTFYGNTAYGLAWALRAGSGPNGFGHNGATVGQSAFLVVFPELDLAISTLTNVTAGGAAKAFEEISHAVVDSLGSFDWPRERVSDGTIWPAPAGLAGRYDTRMSVIRIRAEGDDLLATVSEKSDANLAKRPDHRYVLRPSDGQTFVAIDQLDDGRSVVGFTDFLDGVPQFVFWGGRLAKRTVDTR